MWSYRPSAPLHFFEYPNLYTCMCTQLFLSLSKILSHHHFNPASCHITIRSILAMCPHTLHFISESSAVKIIPIGAVDHPWQHPIFFSHLMAHPGHRCHSRTLKVRAGHSWAQDNPLPARHEAEHPYNAQGHCKHYQARTATVWASILYMRYGVHNIELLDKYFYYDPCASAWIVWHNWHLNI